MNKEVLREIKAAREEAISGLLQDVGFWEEPNAEQKETPTNLIKKGFNVMTFPVSIVNKIKYSNIRKEENYYKEKVEEVLSKKENLIKNV